MLPGSASAILLAHPIHQWLEAAPGYIVHDIRTWLWPCLQLAPRGRRDVLLLAAYELCREEDHFIADDCGWLWDSPTMRAAAIQRVTRAFAAVQRHDFHFRSEGERMRDRLPSARECEPRPVPFVDLAAWAKARGPRRT